MTRAPKGDRVAPRGGDDDHQGGHGADHDGVDERLEEGHDPLRDRLVGLGPEDEPPYLHEAQAEGEEDPGAQEGDDHERDGLVPHRDPRGSGEGLEEVGDPGQGVQGKGGKRVEVIERASEGEDRSIRNPPGAGGGGWGARAGSASSPCPPSRPRPTLGTDLETEFGNCRIIFPSGAWFPVGNASLRSSRPSVTPWTSSTPSSTRNGSGSPVPGSSSSTCSRAGPCGRT
jgi:hypothetical protein